MGAAFVLVDYAPAGRRQSSGGVGWLDDAGKGHRRKGAGGLRHADRNLITPSVPGDDLVPLRRAPATVTDAGRPRPDLATEQGLGCNAGGPDRGGVVHESGKYPQYSSSIYLSRR